MREESGERKDTDLTSAETVNLALSLAPTQTPDPD